MPLRDLLKKKEKIEDDETQPTTPPRLPQASEFTFVRTDTDTQEVIRPPQFDDDLEPSKQRPRFGRFRKSQESVTRESSSSPQKEHKRLSQRLHLNRSESTGSSHVPDNLPEISDTDDAQEKEAQWEARATILANSSPIKKGQPLEAGVSQLSLKGASRSKRSVSPERPRSASDAQSDLNIQEAIRLHEEGKLEEATVMFGRLADSGNVLSQVLYGLALRHGWGCQKDETRAVTYLAQAASNSAAVESEALKAGMKKGGAAKGELVLALFELANCYRNGWGVPVDKVAARQYYETAANLGDTDGMNEAAWCYLEGFGGKKDKFKAAQLLRLAEKNGSKTLGNSWIWKEKYDPK